MKIQITSITTRFTDGALAGVQVHFSGHDEDRTINLNGYVPLTAEEYAGNEAMSALEDIVRNEVSKRVLPSA